MLIIGFILFAYLIVTVYLVYRGSNYIPTPIQERKAIVSFLKKDNDFIDLGCGNGYVLQSALQKGVHHATGYEIDFIRFLISFIRLFPFIVAGKCTLYYLPLWNAHLEEADVVYTFFTSYHMDELYKKVLHEMKPQAWFLSYVHKVPHLKADKTIGNLYAYRQ
jgi:SAM-dependent methyltransferase